MRLNNDAPFLQGTLFIISVPKHNSSHFCFVLVDYLEADAFLRKTRYMTNFPHKIHASAIPIFGLNHTTQKFMEILPLILSSGAL